MIPFLDLSSQNRQVADAVLQRIAAAAAENQFIGGKAVESFEREFATYCDSPHCVALNSGTDALRLALLGLRLPAGSEILTTPFSFVATVETICQAGLKPKFADIDPASLSLSPAAVDARLGPSVSCIVPVHLGGNPCDMTALEASAARVPLLEDACQAHGSRLMGRQIGTFGAAGAFSFYPTKSLGAWGDAGAAVTAREDLAAELRLLRNHGQTGRYYHEVEGWNSRMDAIQAIVLSTKLGFLEAWSRERCRLAALYDSRLIDVEEVTTLKVPATAEPVPYLYSVRARNRDRLREFLSVEGVGTEIVYPYPLHLLPVCSELGYRTGDFPHAEKACMEVISLPMFPGLMDNELDEVCEKIRRFYR